MSSAGGDASNLLIRSAATVVIVRPGRGLEILMVKRSRKLAFMPDLWVFPGGRVDDGDRAIAAAEGREPFRVAAARETQEEVALRLDGAEDDLVEIACWVTPRGETRRYHTRFFLAHVGEHAEVTPDASEIVEVTWLSPALALDAHRAGRLPLAPPTWWTLFEMQSISSVAEALAWARGRTPQSLAPIEPTRSSVEGRPTVRWGADRGLHLVQVDGRAFWEPIAGS